MSSLMIYLTSLVVAFILERQRARHALSLRIRYRRACMSMPQHRPRLPLLESLLTLVLGVLFLAVGSTILWRSILTGEGSTAAGQSVTALLLAAGFGQCLSGTWTLILLGRERHEALRRPGLLPPGLIKPDLQDRWGRPDDTGP